MFSFQSSPICSQPAVSRHCLPVQLLHCLKWSKWPSVINLFDCQSSSSSSVAPSHLCLDSVFQYSCSFVFSEASSAKDPRNFCQSLSCCLYALCLPAVCQKFPFVCPQLLQVHLSFWSKMCPDWFWFCWSNIYPSWLFWSDVCPDWFWVTQINDGTWWCLTARTHIYQRALCSSQWFTLSCGIWMDLLWSNP